MLPQPRNVWIWHRLLPPQQNTPHCLIPIPLGLALPASSSVPLDIEPCLPGLEGDSICLNLSCRCSRCLQLCAGRKTSSIFPLLLGDCAEHGHSCLHGASVCTHVCMNVGTCIVCVCMPVSVCVCIGVCMSPCPAKEEAQAHGYIPSLKAAFYFEANIQSSAHRAWLPLLK